MKNPLLLVLCLFLLSFAANAQGLIVHQGEKGLYVEHSVARSEGLYAIGRNYNVNPKELASFNGIDLNGGLEIGQVLRIPLNATNFNQKNAGSTPVYYVTGSGEGLMKVSNQNNKVTLANIRQWNKLKSDVINAGQPLIVGYLVSKDFKAPANRPAVDVAANNPPAAGTKATEPGNKPAEVNNKTAEANTRPAEPTGSKPVDAVVARPAETTAGKDPDRPVNDQQTPVNKPVVTESAPRNTTPEQAVNDKISSEDGYFKASFDQQVRQSAISSNQTLTSGIFKTSSGWQDAKFYLLMDGVASGTIVRIINPDNSKAIYAKVLGEMNGIRQNQGLDIRISNAAAAALGVTDESKFIVKVSH